jgi:hypothetical protein
MTLYQRRIEMGSVLSVKVEDMDHLGWVLVFAVLT